MASRAHIHQLANTRPVINNGPVTFSHLTLDMCDASACDHSPSSQTDLDFDDGRPIQVPTPCRKRSSGLIQLGEALGEVSLVTDHAASAVAVGYIDDDTCWVATSSNAEPAGASLRVLRGSETDAFDLWVAVTWNSVPNGLSAPSDLDWSAALVERGEVDLGEWSILADDPWQGRAEQLAESDAGTARASGESAQPFAVTEPHVHAVHPNFWSLVDSPKVRSLAASTPDGDRPLAGHVAAYPFLDGGVVFCEIEDPDAWDEDVIGDGIWGVGDDVLAAVCEVLDLQPPMLPTRESPPRTSDERVVDLDAGRTVIGCLLVKCPSTGRIAAQPAVNRVDPA